MVKDVMFCSVDCFGCVVEDVRFDEFVCYGDNDVMLIMFEGVCLFE